MYCTKTFCQNCPEREDCLKIGNVDLENRGAEQASTKNIIVTFVPESEVQL